VNWLTAPGSCGRIHVTFLNGWRMYNAALPAGVVHLIERGLEKDAEKSYQRGQELAAELQQVISLVRSARPS